MRTKKKTCGKKFRMIIVLTICKNFWFNSLGVVNWKQKISDVTYCKGIYIRFDRRWVIMIYVCISMQLSRAQFDQKKSPELKKAQILPRRSQTMWDDDNSTERRETTKTEPRQTANSSQLNLSNLAQFVGSIGAITWDGVYSLMSVNVDQFHIHDHFEINKILRNLFTEECQIMKLIWRTMLTVTCKLRIQYRCLKMMVWAIFHF